MAIIHDVLYFASRTGVPLSILSLDQEKAFDRVDWPWGFMRATLGRMGFKYSFLRRVSLSYTQAQSAVIINGHISSFFSLSRGVRQACPLSPLLYVLVAVNNSLAVNKRCNPRIPSLCLPGVPPWGYFLFISLRMILRSFYQRMTESRLCSIFIPCLRKLRALDLISPSLKALTG